MSDKKINVLELKKRIKELQSSLDAYVVTLARIQADCRHSWCQTVYDPIVQASYTDPGDAPGTMGIDRRGPTYVPRTEKPRWRRICFECDLTEYTEQVSEQASTVPKFDSTAPPRRDEAKPSFRDGGAAFLYMSKYFPVR